MYRSLEKTSNSPFHLYVLCMDDTTYELLTKLNLKSATTIKLKDFESPELLAVKSSRSFGEYCWTCTPSLIKFCLEKHSLEHVTYVDADLFFFSSPELLIDELWSQNGSISLTEHNYSARYDRTTTAGKYCVQFMTFKNNERGLKALNWWRERCIEWCYARFEDGKFGDQKYLDDWLTRFEGVHVLKNTGCGIAPWNVQSFRITASGNGHPLVNGQAVVFYHFHNFQYLNDNSFDLCRSFYTLSRDVVENIYKPYIWAFRTSLRELKTVNRDNQYDQAKFVTWKNSLLSFARKMRGTYYVVEV